MAILLFSPPKGHNLLSTMLHTGLLQLIMVVMVIADRCTRAVPVQEYPAKKVHVLRRFPAACSNWDKAWAWLTKIDCGTKYRLDYVTVPPREVKQYKLQYVCCDGDTNCKADNVHSSGFDSTDVKFLAIVLGSAAACVVIIIVVFAITFYTKKTRCYSTCDKQGHVYSSAEGEESQDSNRDKSQPEDIESESDQKGSEVEYAEISYPKLPRYTDIFKENIEEKSDPFSRASAPPMYSAVTATNYANSEVAPLAFLHPNHIDGMKNIPTTLQTLCKESDDVFGELNQTHQNGAAGGNGEAESENIYYNVREKKRRKKRNSNSNSGSTSSSQGESRRERCHSASSPRSLATGRRSKTKDQFAVNMMVKSSSASETIGITSDAALIKQKRRSAPPETSDIPTGFMHRYPASTHSTFIVSATHTDSNSVCSVINEIVPDSRRPADAGRRTRSSTSYELENTKRNTNPEQRYENSNDSKSRPFSKKYTLSYTSNASDLSNASGSIPASNAVVLTCCDSTSSAIEFVETDSAQPTENDSLLQKTSCQSGCESDHICEDCEHSFRYDSLHPLSPDPDTASLHIYQCLDDVKKECMALRDCSASSSSEISSTKSTVHSKGKKSISRKEKYFGLASKSKGQNKHAPC